MYRRTPQAGEVVLNNVLGCLLISALLLPFLGEYTTYPHTFQFVGTTLTPTVQEQSSHNVILKFNRYTSPMP